MSHLDTKTRILEAAERLFALKGFQRTTIKHLACEARVNLAAINYHFGSKSALVEQVVERRIALINQLRIEALRKIKAAAIRQGCQPDIKDVLCAFIEPACTVTRTIQNEGYFLLIAGRVFYEPDDTIRNVFTRHFKPVFFLLFELMRDVLPNLPERVLCWRIHFAIGALAHAMHLCGSRLPTPDIFPPTENVEAAVELLLPFLTSGMKAPCHRKNENTTGIGR